MSLPPPNWQKSVWDMVGDDPDHYGYRNEDLIVWMRAAALPTFRKLYRRIDHNETGVFANGLPAGNYTLTVEYSECSVFYLFFVIFFNLLVLSLN
jgi:hypothetical protein